jgi:hypothetical protein
VLRLVLTAVALGLSNLAASIGIGLSGVDADLRVRVAVVFGFFEATMPVVGLVLGHRLAASIGSASSYLGSGLLIGVGLYTVVQGHRSAPSPTPARDGLLALVVTGAALSIDNLVGRLCAGNSDGAHRAERSGYCDGQRRHVPDWPRARAPSGPDRRTARPGDRGAVLVLVGAAVAAGAFGPGGCVGDIDDVASGSASST